MGHGIPHGLISRFPPQGNTCTMLWGCTLPASSPPPPPVTRMHLYNDGDARSLHDVADAAAPPVPVGSQTEGGLPVHGASRWKAVLSRS